MTDPIQNAAPGTGATRPAQQPTFLGALRGIWLFTWKPQLAWRRLPVMLILLLTLPVLVYLTISPGLWRERPMRLSDPLGQFSEFERVFVESQHPLTSDQSTRLRQMFVEEFGKAEADLHRAQAANEWSGLETPYLSAGYNRIRNRARDLLDARQYADFRSAAERRLAQSQHRETQPHWSRNAAFHHWVIDIYFFIVLPLQCVRLSGALIRDELQVDTLGFLLTRPLSRAKLVIAKYLAQTAWLQAAMLIEALLLYAVGALQHLGGLGSLVPLFLAAQFLAVLAWSALGLLLGMLSNRYIALALVYGAIVEMGIGRIPTNINTLSVMRHLKALLSRNDLLQSIYDWPASSVPFSVGALLVAAGGFLALAALLFTFFEYHHTAEMQK